MHAKIGIKNKKRGERGKLVRIHCNDALDDKTMEALEQRRLQVTSKHYSLEQLIDVIEDVDILVVRSKTQVTKELLTRGREGKLKLVVRAGVGLDNIDIRAAESLGVQVKSTGAASSRSVAELTLTLVFALSRRILEAHRTMGEGRFLKGQLGGQEIHGKTLGLIGMGHIGQEVANLAKALGMQVIYTNRHGEITELVGRYDYVSMDELLEKSAYISLHMPELPTRKPILTSQEFDLMREGVYVVNTARGSLIDEEALLHALATGKVQGAALDVFKEEPPRNQKIIKHEKILLTPHVGSETEEAKQRVGDAVVTLVDNFLNPGDN